MARTRTTEHGRSRPKSALIDEVARGIEQFQDILVSIEDFSREGFPYRDAARAKAELQLRECVRRIFGERSPEFQTYRNHKLRTSNKSETAQSVRAVKALILTLEEKRLELQGVKPQPAPTPSSVPQMTLVQAAVSSKLASLTIDSASPITLSAAKTSELPVTPPTPPTPLASPPSVRNPTPSATEPIAPSSVASSVAQAPPIPAAAPIPADLPTSTDTTIMDIPAPHPLPSPPPINASVIPASAPPTPAAILQVPASDPPSIRASVHSYSAETLQTQPHIAVASSAPDILRQSVATPVSAEQHSGSLEEEEEHESLERIRKVCMRFHAVSRQLRLRKDYRSTLEVDDDYDLQDLLCALLKMEFDEVGADQWTPPYTEGALRTTFLIHHEQIAVVAKKTRSGLTVKDLTDQVAADSSRYAARDKCTTLFCFIYDPEGRIGSPKRLETDLTSVSDRYMIEVLVAPK